MLFVAKKASHNANNSTFFTGNRNIPWKLAALAMITTPISGVTFISVPGMVMGKGFTYIQMCLGFVVGYFIIALILVPLFYKRQIISIYGFLKHRFGISTYKTGAWLFLVSKILGIGVRFLVVCVMLQILVFEPFHIPFFINVVITMSLIWFSTVTGGVKSVIWTDTLKSICLLSSIVLTIFFISKELNLSIIDIPEKIINHHSFYIFNFDSSDSTYFWKQFLAGIFLVVAMTGLDQDMMQHTLAVKNSKGSKKNLITSGIIQFFVMLLFLSLGTLLLMYAEAHSIQLPERSDDVFATIAFHSEIPLIVGFLFVLGLISSSYSSVGSALTSLTTSYTIDILEGNNIKNEELLKKKRIIIHTIMACIMMAVIIFFYYLNKQDAISAVYTLASYTYGPILGLFAFGIFSRRRIAGKWIPIVCVLSPVISWIIQWAFNNYLSYSIGFELLLINAAITILGLYMIPKQNKEIKYDLPSQIITSKN